MTLLAAACLAALSSPSPSSPLAACGSTPRTAPAATLPADVKSQIEDYLEACEAFGWSGLVYAEKDGKVILHRGYGLADRKARRKNAKGTLFEIASATKPITACAVMALVEDGKVKLSGSIAEHLPGVPEDKKSITVEHLLAHTSGMSRMGSAGFGNDLEKAVATYLSPPRARKPGEAYEYWNGGYALLAAIVANASGTTYQDYCRTRLFERAEMSSTGFTGDEELPSKKQAIGYRGDTPVRAAAEHPYGSYGYQYLGMGGVVSSAKDLARFAKAFDTGKLLKPETAALMVTPAAPSAGLGWRVAETTRGTRRIGHGGDVAGFHTQWQRFPDENAQVIVFSNSETGPPLQLAWNIESLMFGAKPTYPVPPRLGKIAGKELTATEGTYESSGGERITIERVGNEIVLRPGAAKGSGLIAISELGDSETKAWENAMTFLDDVIEGKSKALAPRIVERVPSSWAYQLTGSIWPKHAKQWGALKERKCISVNSSGNGYWTVRVQLEHELGTRPLKMVFNGSKLGRFDLSTTTEKVAGTYVWNDSERFVCFDWIPGPVKRLDFSGGKRHRKRVTAHPGFEAPMTFHRVDE